MVTTFVVVLHVGGSKAFDIKIVLQREPRTGKTWFSAGSIMLNEEHVDAAVRELFQEIGLTLTVDDRTRSSYNHVQVPLPEGKHQHVNVYAASVPVPYVTPSLRTPPKVSQVVVTSQSTINPDGTCVVPIMIDIDGLYLTPSKTGLLKETQCKFELLHFD
jgi:8-oxo-dGTP pyrophosphatase MutT (NUDIX family)